MRTWLPWMFLTVSLCSTGASTVLAQEGNLAKNADFAQSDVSPDGRHTPADFQLTGDAEYRYMGDQRRDISGMGVALQSARDLNGDGKIEGTVSQKVEGLDARAKEGRWYEFSFRGLPQDGFAVEADNLFMRVEYFGEKGTVAMDGKEKKLYSLVEQARRDLTINGDRHAGGAAVWQTYLLRFRLPFPDVDTLKLSVGFSHGKGTRADNAAFFISEWKLAHVEPTPAEIATTPSAAADGVNALGIGGVEKPKGNLIPLGGRWFYLAKVGEKSPPTVFNEANADRLVYHDHLWGTPLAGMMTAVLRAGDMDYSGQVMQKDQLLPDNVTVSFDASSMIIHTKGVPNHPTGRFPESLMGGRGNPSYVQEQRSTYYIPLEPHENPQHFVTTLDNSNHALPMGPIGIAVNGVVFFNPFDLGNTDATNMMDSCCGHPNQDNLYHYHKYPVCINSPWADEGNGHSPLIGWAFDGYPLYGPYEKPGVMAKDITGDGALNQFNMHYDPERGWHYHVTPGKFPYLIGGYWGSEEPRDVHRPPPPGGGRGPGPGRGPGGRGGPPGRDE